MIRECLNVSIPDKCSQKLSLEEERHLISLVKKALVLLDDSGTIMTRVGRNYRDAIDLEIERMSMLQLGMKELPKHRQYCLVCGGSGISHFNKK